VLLQDQRMHQEDDSAPELALSSPGYLPVTARRLSQKLLLILLSGDMWVSDLAGQRREITGPTWVVWYPGESIEYGEIGETVHWLFAAPTGPVPPGMPRPGSLVRLAGDLGAGVAADEALLLMYMDDTADQTGITSVAARGSGGEGGVGIHPLTAVGDVLDEADEDRRAFSYGPGLDGPLRRTARSRR
jgi:hypothetical protein